MPKIKDARVHVCSDCQAFSRRCIYCPSDAEQWHQNRETGYTPSVGQLWGAAVCSYHKFGRVPERVEYREIAESGVDKPTIQIFRGGTFKDDELIFGVSYQKSFRRFWIHFHEHTDAMSPEEADQSVARWSSRYQWADY